MPEPLGSGILNSPRRIAPNGACKGRPVKRYKGHAGEAISRGKPTPLFLAGTPQTLFLAVNTHTLFLAVNTLPALVALLRLQRHRRNRPRIETS